MRALTVPAIIAFLKSSVQIPKENDLISERNTGIHLSEIPIERMYIRFGAAFG